MENVPQKKKKNHAGIAWFALVCCSLFQALSVELPRRSVQESFMVLCVILSFVLFLIIAINRKREEVVSRWNIALLLYIPFVSVFVLGRLFPILYYFRSYIVFTFFVCMSLVGLVTTFFTEAGFIGLKFDNRKMVRKASIKFLIAIICITICTFIFAGNWSSPDLFMMFFVLSLLQSRWIRQITGEKGSNLAFKWRY